MENIEKFLKNNLPDYETALTFEAHQMKIMMFEWGKSQAKEIEQLKEVSDENDRLVDELLKFKAVKRENTKLKEQFKELEIICSELVKLPKGIESHSYSDYLKNK